MFLGWNGYNTLYPFDTVKYSVVVIRCVLMTAPWLVLEHSTHGWKALLESMFMAGYEGRVSLC